MKISENTKGDKPNKYYLISFLFTIAYSILKFPFFMSGGVWAESATNYYTNSISKSLWANLFSLDAGYLSLPLRIEAWVISNSGISVSVIPYIYSTVSICLSAMLFSYINLSVFRRIIPNDGVRFCASLAMCVLSDFETRTFINYLYFAIPFVFLCTLKLYSSIPDLKYFWILPFLMFSKPLMLATIPFLLLTFLHIKQIKIRIIIAICSLMAIAQLVIMKNNLSAFALNEKIPLLERLQNSIVFFMGFQGAWINYFWRTSTDVTVALGLFLTLLALALAKKSRGYNRIGILGILLTIYSIVVIESFAVTNTFGSGNFAIFSTNLSLNRYTIPIFHLQIILICILFSGAPLRVTRIVWRNKELAQGMKMPMIVIFSLSLLILNSEIPRSGFPLTGNSRWVKLSEKINTGKPVCIPIDPIGWYYSQGCSLLYPLGAFQGFLGFEKQGLLKGKEFKIPVPREVNGKNLILITILVKPTTDLKAEIEAQLTYTLETGEQSVIHGHQIIGGSGGQLEFVLPSAIMLKNNSILQLSFSESVVVGNNQFSGTANSGAMYYGY